jgi:hypothetical protein
MQPCSIVRTAGNLALWIVILVLTQLTAFGQNRSPPTDTPPSSGGTVALDDCTIALQPWKGDYDGMVQRRMVRIAVPYSMTRYFLDGAVERGISAAMGRRLEQVINQKEGLRTRLVHVVFIPVPRSQLISYLTARATCTTPTGSTSRGNPPLTV